MTEILEKFAHGVIIGIRALELFGGIQDCKIMKENDYKILCELKEKLSEKIMLLDMRIFGSRSREDADEFSDLDVFIETETLDRETKETIKDITWEVGIRNMAVISPLIFSKYDLTVSPLRYSPVAENIMNEGIRI